MWSPSPRPHRLPGGCDALYLSSLSATGFHYWALGHIHRRGRVAADLPAWYAGNLQGRSPRETGPKGVLYVEIAPDRPVEPEFVPLAPIIWDRAEIVCPPTARTFDELAEQLQEAIRVKVDLDDGAAHLVRVELTGQSPLAPQLRNPDDVLQLVAELRNLHVALGSGTDITRSRQIRTGRWVRIVCGALAGVEGVVVGWRSRVRVALNINILGQSVTVETDADLVELIDPPAYAVVVR